VAKLTCDDYLSAMFKNLLPLFSAICLVFLPVSATLATPPKTKPAATTTPTPDPGAARPLGSDGAWSAYLAQNKAGKVCYLVGTPEKSESAGLKRKTVMAMVTHRTEDNVSNVVSFDEGYPLNESNDVIVEVGTEKFPLFAKDDTAWARTSDIDKSIVTALAKEKQAVVKGTPKKGHPTTDIYSLAGFSKALALIDKACDVKR
jgi:Invasion associated locus B (IalB) protein